MNEVKLIGLDFGTTTSSAVVARAKLLHNSVTGRVELSQVAECFHSDIVFTPFANDRIDESQIAALLDGWLASGLEPGDALFGGGALLTGLTAQKANAAALVTLIRDRIGDAVIARADDPRLEAWLAFMGSCAALSRRHPRIGFINLDIGGGTTNIALGVNGEVLATGCLFVGARHVQVEPGTYRIVRLSDYARRLFDDSGIRRDCGDVLSEAEREIIIDQYVRWLFAATSGDVATFTEPVAGFHQQAEFRFESPANIERIVVTLSGGVGELVYAAGQDRGFPATTAFGDLGIDLARRLSNSSNWVDDFRDFVPEAGGRATSFGLLRHSTQVSGSTLFLADPTILPLRDLPIVGTIDAALPVQQWQTILELLRISSAGGCVQIEMRDHRATAVRELGASMAQSLKEVAFPATQPLVVIVPGNVGKALGHYITAWGTLPLALVVIDEIAVRDAQFVHLGRLHDRVVPVSYYGLQT